MIKQLILTLILSCLTVSALSFADSNRADNIHEEVCTDCHSRMTGGDGSVLYTRKHRMVNSLAKLQERVQYCAQGANANWQTNQVEQVVNYLNKQYYRF